MANYANLKSAIQQVIKTNGNEEITGALLQQSLLAMIDNLGGYQFAGVAVPTTDPGTPDKNVFYFATTPGAYPNFGNGMEIGEGWGAFFKYDGTWTANIFQLFRTTTGNSISVGMTQRAITQNLMIYKAQATDLYAPMEVGVYTFAPTASNLPLDYTGAWGWMIVFNPNFRLVFSSSTNGGAWVNYNVSRWVNLNADAMVGISTVANEILATIQSGVDNGVYDLGGEEISGAEILDNRLLLWDSGKPYSYTNQYWKVKKYPVSPNTAYHILGSTLYGNAIFSVVDAGDTLLHKERNNVSGNQIINKIYTTPGNAEYIYIAYVTTINTGILTTVSLKYGSKKWLGKKWVCIGDSLTESNSRTTKHYFDYIAEATGIQVVNMGVSGSGYKRLEESNNAFYQRAANVPTDADIITIFGSGNDGQFVTGGNLGSPSDTTSATLCGCINLTLDTILSRFIAAGKIPTIGVITPTPWEGTPPSNPDNWMSQMSDAIIACCKYKSIPVLDLFRCSNLHPDIADFRALAYSKDDGNGVHPDETGHKIIAPMFEWFVDSLLIS